MLQMSCSDTNENRGCVQQTDINAKMRAILIDWLVEVHQKFKLLPDTLFLTINIIDRFLQKKSVTRKNLQLVWSSTASCPNHHGMCFFCASMTLNFCKFACVFKPCCFSLQG